MLDAYVIAAFLIGCLVGYVMGRLASLNRQPDRQPTGLRAIETELDYAQNNPQLPANEVPALILRDLIGANRIAPTETEKGA
jgi:hypothetical protein